MGVEFGDDTIERSRIILGQVMQDLSQVFIGWLGMCGVCKDMSSEALVLMEVGEVDI